MQYPVLRSENSLTKYIRDISQFPVLSKEEEFECAKKVHDEGDLESAKILITSHLRFVVKIASQFRNYGLPMTDLISEGTIGLMQAVKKFNPYKGFCLATYAIWWIKAAIQEYILHSWSLVKIGTTSAQKKLFFNLRKIKAKIMDFGRYNLEKEDIKVISESLNVSKQEVIDMDSRLQAKDASLNARVSQDDEDAVEIIDTLPSQEEALDLIVDANREKAKSTAMLNNALAKLKDREREILIARRFYDQPETLESLSQKHNISRERVRQIEARAIEKIKKEIIDS
jgi:RNA polymerase sigma-32 factor